MTINNLSSLNCMIEEDQLCTMTFIVTILEMSLVSLTSRYFSGVTDENVAEVHWCLQTSHVEKIARVAAKKLFRALNPLDFPVLTKEQYRQAVDEVSSSKREKKLLEKAVKFKTENDVSEDVFVEKIVKRLRGSGSLTSDPMNSVESEAYENAGLYQKVRMCIGVISFTVYHYTELHKEHIVNL